MEFIDNAVQGVYDFFSPTDEEQPNTAPQGEGWDEVANSIVPEVNPNISGIMKPHAARLGVDYDEAIDNALGFATYVGLVENSGETYGENVPEKGKKQTSAQGLYQFLDDDSKGQSSWQTGLNRTQKYLGQQEWISDTYEYGAGGVNLTTRNQQTAVFLADLLEQKGSDKLMKGILEGDMQSFVDCYLKLHYKGKPTAATIKHAEDVFKSKSYLDDTKSIRWNFTGE
jgi:hypothetical protein